MLNDCAIRNMCICIYTYICVYLYSYMKGKHCKKMERKIKNEEKHYIKRQHETQELYYFEYIFFLMFFMLKASTLSVPVANALRICSNIYNIYSLLQLAFLRFFFFSHFLFHSYVSFKVSFRKALYRRVRIRVHV